MLIFENIILPVITNLFCSFTYDKLSQLSIKKKKELEIKIILDIEKKGYNTTQRDKKFISNFIIDLDNFKGGNINIYINNYFSELLCKPTEINPVKIKVFTFND